MFEMTDFIDVCPDVDVYLSTKDHWSEQDGLLAEKHIHGNDRMKYGSTGAISVDKLCQAAITPDLDFTVRGLIFLLFVNDSERIPCVSARGRFSACPPRMNQVKNAILKAENLLHITGGCPDVQ